LNASRARFRLAFLAAPGPREYAEWFARWRWRTAFSGAEAAGETATDLSPQASAATAFAGGAWLVVLDGRSIPLPSAAPPELVPGRVVAASGPASPAPVAHTLRELERSASSFSEGGGAGPFSAILFRAADFPAPPGESVGDYLRRLGRAESVRAFDPRLAALPAGDPFGHDRAEVTRHLPPGSRRLLDVGCGAGEAARSLKRLGSGLSVTGIESHPEAARRARAALDRLLEGDAPEMLSRLAAAGERFDAFLFADVLEHLDDPVGALIAARGLALPGATLLASVPNAGHLSLVRDLIVGRFDPVPAGLADGGHLRWFTRASLREALAESGWRVERIDPLPGGEPQDAEDFFAWLSEWAPVDREGLSAYQWLAVARADAA